MTRRFAEGTTVSVEKSRADLETEFLAQTMLPNGSTVGEWMAPQLEDVYSTGQMPALVPGARPALSSGGR